MPLAHSGGSHAPALVHQISTFVEPVCLVAELRSYPWQHGPFLLFQEESLHDRIHPSSRPRYYPCAAGWCYGQQIGVAHAFASHIGGKRLPLLRVIASFPEIFPGLPVAALEIVVPALLTGKLATGLDGRKIYPLEDLVHEL